MPQRDGIFAGDDPFDIVGAWMRAAAETEPNDPDAMSLATVDASGMPNVRIVLLKQIEPDGLVFYTNRESAKGQEIAATGQAAVALHWKTLRRQVRARGLVAPVSDEISDSYYASRALDSRIGAWASQQSRPLESRDVLTGQVEEFRDRFGDAPPRPPHWGGFRIVPTEIEFWADGAYRLHDRFQWRRPGLGHPWTVSRLYP